MSEPKEPGYFVEELNYYPSDEDWYLSLFEEGADAEYRGESSTHYTKLPVYPGVPERIAAYCDDPHFIYLMRDPIDRAISHYWHRTRKEGEFRPPLRAMKEHADYKAFGEYARQLEPYLKIFPSERIFLTTFECLTSNPGSVTSEILTWLGLDPGAIPKEFPTENAAPGQINRFMLGQKLGNFLHGSKAWDALSPIVPQSLKEIGKMVTMKSVAPAEVPMEPVIAYLRPWAARTVGRIEDLLQRTFPEWTTSRNST